MPFAKKLGLAGMGTSLVVAGALLVGGSAGAAPAIKAAPAAPSIESAWVQIPGGSTNSTSVNCPTGTVVTGGGGRTSASDIFFTDSYQSGNGWYIRGKNIGSSTQSILATAVCAGTPQS